MDVGLRVHLVALPMVKRSHEGGPWYAHVEEEASRVNERGAHRRVDNCTQCSTQLGLDGHDVLPTKDDQLMVRSQRRHLAEYVVDDMTTCYYMYTIYYDYYYIWQAPR